MPRFAWYRALVNRLFGGCWQRSRPLNFDNTPAGPYSEWVHLPEIPEWVDRGK